MTTGSAHNDADLSYVRDALRALRDAGLASDAVVAGARDPRLRASARRTRVAQRDDVRALTSLMREWGRTVVVTRPVAAASAGTSAADVPVSDRGLVALLVAQAEASIRSARIEMVAGFGTVSRAHAEGTIRAGSRELAVLRRLEPEG